jgi:hypothetical protein
LHLDGIALRYDLWLAGSAISRSASASIRGSLTCPFGNGLAIHALASIASTTGELGRCRASQPPIAAMSWSTLGEEADVARLGRRCDSRWERGGEPNAPSDAEE